jgi:DNA-binding CsgD family transcriptional regulator
VTGGAAIGIDCPPPDDVRAADPWCWAQLTPREREIAELLPAGLSNKEIAARLAVSPSYVRNLLGQIQTKLVCQNRVQLAVAVALRR